MLWRVALKLRQDVGWLVAVAATSMLEFALAGTTMELAYWPLAPETVKLKLLTVWVELSPPVAPVKPIKALLVPSTEAKLTPV